MPPKQINKEGRKGEGKAKEVTGRGGRETNTVKERLDQCAAVGFKTSTTAASELKELPCTCATTARP